LPPQRSQPLSDLHLLQLLRPQFPLQSLLPQLLHFVWHLPHLPPQLDLPHLLQLLFSQDLQLLLAQLPQAGLAELLHFDWHLPHLPPQSDLPHLLQLLFSQEPQLLLAQLPQEGLAHEPHLLGQGEPHLVWHGLQQRTFALTSEHL
jgi:hypothetical protein